MPLRWVYYFLVYFYCMGCLCYTAMVIVYIYKTTEQTTDQGKHFSSRTRTFTTISI